MKQLTKQAKRSMRAAVWLVAFAGLAACATPTRPTEPCPRAAYWIGADSFEDDAVRSAYLVALEEAFSLDARGLPTRGAVAYFRLSELERYCFQMR